VLCVVVLRVVAATRKKEILWRNERERERERERENSFHSKRGVVVFCSVF
jgi:hypothetical protein